MSDIGAGSAVEVQFIVRRALPLLRFLAFPNRPLDHCNQMIEVEGLWLAGATRLALVHQGPPLLRR
jgi:hypothetical protein